MVTWALFILSPSTLWRTSGWPDQLITASQGPNRADTQWIYFLWKKYFKTEQTFKKRLSCFPSLLLWVLMFWSRVIGRNEERYTILQSVKYCEIP
jgi:hypothetical protein